jgi:hypothetical protein
MTVPRSCEHGKLANGGDPLIPHAPAILIRTASSSRNVFTCVAVLT